MGKRSRVWGAGFVAGGLLLIVTCAAGAGSAASGSAEPTQAQTSVKDLRQDRAQIAALKAQLAHLDTSITTLTAHVKGQEPALTATAGDEVSAAVASLFGAYARDAQSIAAQAAAFHEQFVQALRAAGSSTAGSEAP